MVAAEHIPAMRRLLATSLAFVVSAAVVLALLGVARNGPIAKDLTSSSSSKTTSTGCDFFSGTWVPDDNSSLYSEKGCKFMSEIVACEEFGRKDLGYRRWRWQPHSCNLPRFERKLLMEKLKGKRMAFVGDSLTWNQWVSMACLLEKSIPSSHKTFFQPKGPIKVLKDLEYNISIEHHWNPLLAESNGDDPVHNQFPHRIVRAESIAKNARGWMDADFLVFDSYVWWKLPEIRLWWGSLNDTDGVYKDVESVRAFELMMRTWAAWLEFHADMSRTKIFFMSMSPTHFKAEDWGGESKRNCYGETEPIDKEGYRGSENDRRLERVAEAAIEGLRSRGVEVQLLNITRLSEYRKDAHPSIYRQFWNTVPADQRGDPTKYADCTHWCLPGVPDVWNHLLYAYIVGDNVDR